MAENKVYSVAFRVKIAVARMAVADGTSFYVSGRSFKPDAL